MYYLLVYSQLVLLTPVLFRLLSRYRFFVYCVTPACLLLRELAAVAGIALPLIQVFCPMWLIFYVFGLDWRRWAALIEGRTTQLVAVLFIFLIIQEVAGNSSRSFFLIAKLAYFDLATPITTAARQFIGAVSIGSCEGRSGHACCRVPHQPTLHPVYCFGLPMRFAGRVLCRRGRPHRAGDGLTRQKTSMQSRCAYRRRVIRIESKHPHEGYQLDWTPHGDPQHPVQ